VRSRKQTRAKIVLSTLLAFVCAPAILPQSPDDAHVLAVIHQRLAEPNRVTYNHPIVFVGAITKFGPVFQGVCKAGVGEDVDYEVLQWIYGEGQRTEILTSYINCTRQPLPSPPFTLGAKVIVYCEAPHGAFLCLNPVAYSDNVLRQLQHQTASLQPNPRR
jgi:hypothetical protein